MTEDDLAAALDELAENLPISTTELLARCRETATVEGLALALNADIARLNSIIEQLGPPYRIIDRTEAHQATLAAFLSRQQSFIRESVRAHFWPTWSRFDDLTAYRAARSATSLTLPEGIGRSKAEISQAELHSWLGDWLAALGVEPVARLPSSRDAIDAVREGNHRLLRSMVPLARVAALLKGDFEQKQRWAAENEAERLLVEQASSAGWVDFELLNEATALRWMARDGWWYEAWGDALTLEALKLTQEDIDGVRADDKRARDEASIKRQQIAHSGGVFTVGHDTYASLVDEIAARTFANEGLLATSTRPLRGLEKVILRQSRTGAGGKPSIRQPLRKSDEERKLIGFFGEMIAFAWLKEKFGRHRVIDEHCWKSLYRTEVYGGTGDDSLGYDFEINTGKHVWQFEVKATAGDEMGDRQMVELGSSEIAKAESCRAEGRSHYRILFVSNALQPEHARIFVLHNPRSRQGLSFYTEQESAGVRLHFPLRNG